MNRKEILDSKMFTCIDTALDDARINNMHIPFAYHGALYYLYDASIYGVEIVSIHATYKEDGLSAFSGYRYVGNFLPLATVYVHEQEEVKRVLYVVADRRNYVKTSFVYQLNAQGQTEIVVMENVVRPVSSFYRIYEDGVYVRR